MDGYKEVTIYDIARKLSLSASTVSRALASHHTVSLKNKARVLETARQMGYRSNFVASNLRKKRSNIIGVIVPRLNSYFIADVIAGIERTIYQANYNLIISQSFETLGKEIKNAASMYNNRVDGLLVSLSNESQNIDHFDVFVKRNIPVIFFDKTPSQAKYPEVTIDNVKAAYQITTHLIEHGCRHIAHITTNKLHSVYIDRFKGYRQALTDNNIDYQQHMVITTCVNEPDPTDLTNRILALPQQADGIFTANDLCAVECIKGLKVRGLSIPNDIAVAGFNNDPLSCIIEPHLTTINYKGTEMGEVAARELLTYLDGNNQHLLKLNKILIGSEIVIRESSLKQ